MDGKLRSIRFVNELLRVGLVEEPVFDDDLGRHLLALLELLDDVEHRRAEERRALDRRAHLAGDLIGPDMVFMVDANMKWTIEHAVKAAKALRPFNIYWLEEPTIPDDYDGYGRISAESGLPVAAGENLHTVYEFRNMIERGNIDFPQPDASNIGGITGWLKVANLAYAHNLPVCTHSMQELHVSLMSAMPHASYLEVHSFPIDAYTTRPLVIRDGRAVAPDAPGTGVEFRWDRLQPYKSEFV